MQIAINMEDYGVIFIQLFEWDTFGNVNANSQRKVVIFRGAPCISARSGADFSHDNVFI